MDSGWGKKPSLLLIWKGIKKIIKKKSRRSVVGHGYEYKHLIGLW